MLSLHNNVVPDLSGTRRSSKKSRLRHDDDCTTKLLNRVPLAKAGGILICRPCDKGRFKLEWFKFMAMWGISSVG